jgi:predicted O-methyltransferase YrrM
MWHSMNNRQFGWGSRVAGRVVRILRMRVMRRELRRSGLAYAHRIQTFTMPEELEILFELARSVRVDARVLEIGSYLGASTCCLAAGLRGRMALVTCVDTWQNETMPDGLRDTFQEFQANLEPVWPRIRVIRKRTCELTRIELDGPFDLVFIDGDHTLRQVRADFELVSPLLTPDGILVFHDSRYYEGVSRVIGEALASGHWQLGGTVANISWLVRAHFSVSLSVHEAVSAHVTVAGPHAGEFT